MYCSFPDISWIYPLCCFQSSFKVKHFRLTMIGGWREISILGNLDSSRQRDGNITVSKRFYH